MKLRSLRVHNFQSFSGTHHFNLADHSFCFIYGENEDSEKADSNGAGKTTIFNAISWALYGLTPSGASKDDLIHHGADEVSVELSLDGLTIQRYKKRHKSEVVKFRPGDGTTVFGDLLDTQQKLIELLGVDFNTFCNTVFLSRSSKTIDFVRAKPSERAKVLSNLVDDSAFQDAAKLVLKDINQSEIEINFYERRLKELERTAKKLLDSKQQAQARWDEAEARSRNKREATLKEMEDIKKQIETLQLAFTVDSVTNLEALSKEKVVWKKKFTTISETLINIATSLSNAEKAKYSTGNCPTCLRPIDEACMTFIEETREELLHKQKHYTKLKKLVEQKIKKLEEEIEQAIEIDRKKTDAEEKIKALTREFKLLKDILLEASSTHHAQLVNDINAEIAENAEAIADCNLKCIHFKEQNTMLKTLKRVFQQDLRNMLFDSVRTNLTYYTKIYLHQLAGFGYDVEYPPVSKTGAEKFEILMKARGYDQDLSNYSEGESWRVTFAILLALRQCLQGCQTGAVFDFLLVDDPVGALDERGVENFISALSRYQQERKTQIFITLPRTTPVEGIEHTSLRVRKRNGSSILC